MNINNLQSIEKVKFSKAKIAVVITAHNSLKTIVKTLQSIYNQKNCSDYIVLISDDFSNEKIKTVLNTKIQDTRFIYFEVNFHSVYKNRNYLLHIVYQYGYNIELIIRCDSDDMFYDDFVLSRIEKSFFTSSTIRKKCDFLLGGNTLYQNAKDTNKINLATNLLKNNNYLLDRLYCMSQGYVEFELPSCNFVFKKGYDLFYPSIKSAEDHFLLVYSLMCYKKHSFRIDEDLMIMHYSLSGSLTKNNKKTDYLIRRKELYDFTYERIFL